MRWLGGGEREVYRVNINAALATEKVLLFQHRKYYYCNYTRDNFRLSNETLFM